MTAKDIPRYWVVCVRDPETSIEFTTFDGTGSAGVRVIDVDLGYPDWLDLATEGESFADWAEGTAAQIADAPETVIAFVGEIVMNLSERYVQEYDTAWWHEMLARARNPRPSKCPDCGSSPENWQIGCRNAVVFFPFSVWQYDVDKDWKLCTENLGVSRVGDLSLDEDCWELICNDCGSVIRKGSK